MLKRNPRTSSVLAIIFVMMLGIAFTRESVVEADQPIEKKIAIVTADGKRDVSTTMGTVGEALEELGISFDSNDKISHKPGAAVKNGMIIFIKKVDVKEVKEINYINFETLRTFSRDQRHGSKTTVQEGVKGEKEVTYKVTFENGKQVSKIPLSSNLIKEPKPCVVSIGSRGQYTSRGETYKTSNVISMKASAYDSESFRGRKTSLGLNPVYSMAAVDPRVIPLGSKLYIEGYGYAIAGDTGGAIKGNRIDLCFATKREALQFGRRTVKVHVLKRL